MQSILLIEDRENLRKLYADFLRKHDYLVREAGSAEEASKMMNHHEFGLVVTDYMLPGINGLDFLKQIKSQNSEQSVIVMTAFGEVRLAVEAMKNGAADFLEKPIDLEHFKLIVARTLRHDRLEKRERLDQHDRSGPILVAESQALKEVVAMGDQVATSDVACLLLGESGVGKELFAQRIHRKSPRSSGTMISVNCAAIPRDLIESELFGHEKGAFTGAVSKKSGLIEMADGGTLFLDEIGELPLDLQPKLLRVIQTGEFRRVGGSKLLHSKIRLICATNRDLVVGTREGWFREDLYYRIAVFPIKIPPLRERKGDILPIASQILSQAGYHIPLTESVQQKLGDYSWPGNVRELKNILERAVILSAGKGLSVEHLPADMKQSQDQRELKMPMDLTQSLKENLKTLEVELTRQLIVALLEEKGGHREQVAAVLGVSVKTLYNKMQGLGIKS